MKQDEQFMREALLLAQQAAELGEVPVGAIVVKDGVIDPVKVTRSALANAASIAAMFITTEALVFETPEEKKEEAAGHGHSHGPGGHSH